MSVLCKKNVIVAAASMLVGMAAGAAAALIVVEKRFTYKLRLNENERKGEVEFGEALVDELGDQP